MKAIVGERGQVTIPKALRERLGIAPRMVLDFREENGRLVAEKVTQGDPVAQVTGCLELDRPTDELVAELRGDT
jgi:antitoxin PrlF